MFWANVSEEMAKNKKIYHEGDKKKIKIKKKKRKKEKRKMKNKRKIK